MDAQNAQHVDLGFKQRARAQSSFVLNNQLAFLLSRISIAVDSRG